MCEAYFIALDGGGTKTDAVLFRSDGQVMSRTAAGKSNLHDRPVEELTSEFTDLKNRLTASLPGIKITGVHAGMAGGADPKVNDRFRDVLSRVFAHEPVITIDHDGYNALYAGTDGQPGVTVIAGTGSLVFAVDAVGQAHRSGGWGYLIGDEGSGFDLGRRAMAAVMAAVDGRGPDTALTGLICRHHGVSHPAGLIAPMYREGKTYLSKLAPLAMEAADRGDPVALDIFGQCAGSLAAVASPVVEACLSCRKEDTPLSGVLSGGLWNHEQYRRCFTEQAGFGGRIRWIVPSLPPVYGAAVMALAACAITPDHDFRQHFERSHRLKEDHS